MENASKALIIAGAILLSILLISLSIMIFNQAQDVINGSGMTKAELQTYNSAFTKYEGSQRGSMIRSLIQEAIATNANEDNINAGRHVTINGEEPESITGIKNTTTYTVSFDYEKGRVSNVKVEGL